MIKRITIGDYRLTFTFAKVAKVIGVNSNLDSGRHVLMWDFDDVKLGDVRQALKVVQTRYFLSDISILVTKAKSNYMAYCFSSQEWRRAVEIVAATDYVDYQFLRFSVYRGHFTLRVSPKGDRVPLLITKLDGYELPDCSPEDLKSWVKYETLSWR